MGRGSGLAGLLALLGLALVFGKRKSFAPGGYSHFMLSGQLPHTRIIAQRGMTMPKFPDYPQVTDQTRLDPRTPDYQAVLGAKYPQELEETRQAYAQARAVIGLRPYVAPPMPRTSRRR